MTARDNEKDARATRRGRNKASEGPSCLENNLIIFFSLIAYQWV